MGYTAAEEYVGWPKNRFAKELSRPVMSKSVGSPADSGIDKKIL